MCSNSYGLTLSRSNLRFSPLPPSSTFQPDPFPAVFFPVKRFNPRLQIASIKVRSMLNDVSSFADPISFYDLLGISETGSLLEIKHAYKQLARKYHPDVSPPDRVEEHTRRFIRVQEAYETLSDPRRRALYDRDIAKGLNFALSSRWRRENKPIEVDVEWSIRWQSQLSELKRRSKFKDSNGGTSWGARMRRQRDEDSS
ncbi:unnamed protein product [Cuscuta europaea]|uniref:J domain-containing protein n=1 Tax=Cuscuta europaea TaxID=41803 RepID=A0A9P0YPI7_CUSEU|nr:unnamed protein product [Cuscuta europaea]